MHRDTGSHPHGLPPLHDDVALDEIELYGEVLIAVADSDGPLSPAELDRALGLADEVGGPAQDALAEPVPSPDPSSPNIRPRPDTPRPLSHIDSSTNTTPPTAEAAAEPSLFPYVLPPPTTPHCLLRLG